MRLLVSASAILLAGCSARPASAPSYVTLAYGAIDFGSVAVGSSVTREVPYTVRGPDQARVDGSTVPAGFAAVVDSGVLRITFAPETPGTFSADILVRDGGISVAARVLGSAYAWAVTAQPAQLDFGGLRAGQSVDLPLDLQNSMGIATEVYLSTDVPMFGVTAEPLELEPGATARVNVQFAPWGRGPISARLQLAPCPGCKGPVVDLSGTGLIEHFAVDPSSLDFGREPVGVTTCREVAVHNDGDLPIVFAKVDPDAHFKADGAFDLRVGAMLDGSAIAPGAGTTFRVCFDPANQGKAYGGSVHLGTFGGASGSLAVLGTGVGPSLTAYPVDVDLGVVKPGTPTARDVILGNKGDASSLVISSVQLGGGDPALQLAFPDGDPVGRDVGASSFRIQVVMNGGMGEHQGTVVVESTDGETAYVHVHGVVVDGTPCDLAVPGRVAFGMVHYQESYTRDVTVVNTNPTAACFVWGFGLDPAGDPNPSDKFSVSGAPDGITSIPAGGKLKLTILYAPTVASIDPDTQTLSFNQVTSSGLDPTVKIPISGFATQLDLSLSPDPIDFGTVEVGAPVHLTVSLTNNGTRLIKVGGNRPTPNPNGDIGMSVDSAPGFSVYKTPTEWPQTLAGNGGTMEFDVVFQAQAPGHYEGTLEIWLQNTPEPILVPVVADAVGPACEGYPCADRIAECPIALIGEVGSPLDLGGRVFQQHQPGSISCQWSVLSAPAGSSAAIEAGGGCGGKLTPDVAGDYTLQLSAMDDAGWSGTCQTKVTAEGQVGLVVQTTWDWPDDLDLYLFHALAGDPSSAAAWSSWSYACDYQQRHPDWDSLGHQDDPLLLADDQTGQGPEVIEIPVPGAGETYAIGVHWYGDGHGNGTETATTRITCGDTEVAEVQTMIRNYAAAWVGNVTWNGDGTCSFTPKGGSITLIP